VHAADEPQCAAVCPTTKPPVAAVPPMCNQTEAGFPASVVAPVVCSKSGFLRGETDTQDCQKGEACTSASPARNSNSFGKRTCAQLCKHPIGAGNAASTGAVSPQASADAHTRHWHVPEPGCSHLNQFSFDFSSNGACSQQCPRFEHGVGLLDASHSTPSQSPSLQLDMICNFSRPSLATRDLTADFARLPKIEAAALQLEVPEATKGLAETHPKVPPRSLGGKAKAANLCDSPQDLKSPRLDCRRHPS
jgi:hypothetical protein